jgi:hypothetical protein
VSRRHGRVNRADSAEYNSLHFGSRRKLEFLIILKQRTRGDLRILPLSRWATNMEIECDEQTNRYAGHSSHTMKDLLLLTLVESPPRLSGFLKMEQTKSCCALLPPKWKERFFLLVEYHDIATLIVFRKQYEMIKRIDVDRTHRVLPTDDNSFCFQVADSNSKRITLAATSELQMRMWVDCLNSE